MGLSLTLLPTEPIPAVAASHCAELLVGKRGARIGIVGNLGDDGVRRLGNLFLVKLYALCERALLYDWCICSGEYSLTLYSQKMMPLFLEEARGQ